MNQATLIGIISLIGFLVILGLVIYETEQKMQEYLSEHPNKNPTQLKIENQNTPTSKLSEDLF